MVAARVGSIQTGGNSTASTSISVTLPNTATAGNLLIVGLSLGKASDVGDPTCTSSGWTLLGNGWQQPGIESGGAYFMGKIAAGGETSVTFTTSPSTQVSWGAQEWSGLNLSPFPVGPTAPATYGGNTNDSGTLTSNTRTTATPNEVVFSIFAGRDDGSGVTAAFGAGPTVDLGAATGRVQYLYLLSQTVAASGSSITHNVTSFTNNNAPTNRANVMGSVAFKSAPGTYTADASRTGTGTLTATAVVSGPLAATLAGTGTLSSAATRSAVASATSLVGTGALTATLDNTNPVDGSINATGTLSATAARNAVVTATRAGVGTLSATVSNVQTITASLVGVGTLSATVAVLRNVIVAANVNPATWEAELVTHNPYRANLNPPAWASALEER